MPMSVDVVTAAVALQRLEPEWRALWQQDTAWLAVPVAGLDSAVVGALPDRQGARVITVRHEGRLLGPLPSAGLQVEVSEQSTCPMVALPKEGALPASSRLRSRVEQAPSQDPGAGSLAGSTPARRRLQRLRSPDVPLLDTSAVTPPIRSIDGASPGVRDNSPLLVTKAPHMVYFFAGAEGLRRGGARRSTIVFQAPGVERAATVPVVRNAGSTTAKSRGPVE